MIGGNIKNSSFVYLIALALILAVSVLGASTVHAVPMNPLCQQTVPYGGMTPSSPSPTGTGYIYRTIRVSLRVPDSEFDIVGGMIRSDQVPPNSGSCDVSSAWTLGGQTVYAVQAELGRKLDSHVGASLAEPEHCVPIAPTYPDDNNDGVADPIVQGCMASHGDYPIYQDDAAMIAVNGTAISCIGIWPCGNVFERGVSPSGRLADDPVTTTRSSTAHRGAGFVNIPPRTLAGNGSSTIDDLSVFMIAGNTWPGNHESSILITMKYKQNPPTGTSGCTFIGSVPNTVTVGTNFNVGLRLTNGSGHN